MIMRWFGKLLLTSALFSAVAATSLRTVSITDGEQLKEFLCSPQNTIAPNTNLNIVKNGIEIANVTDHCLVENTSNISITSSYYNSDYDADVAIVYCSNRSDDVSMTDTFSFFNVTNLTISSVLFLHCGLMPLPPAATKYINGFDQMFEYTGDTLTTFLFNHCNNVTLYNVFANASHSGQVHSRTSIIGVNLCGQNNITSLLPRDFDVPLVTLSIYYVDSNIMSEEAECNLHIQSNMLSANKHSNIVQFLKQGAERLPVVPYRDLAVIAAQENFKVDINVEILPMMYLDLIMDRKQDCTHVFCSVSVLIMFVNDVNTSHVTFQGYPYEYCTDPSTVLPHPYSRAPIYRPIQLDVILYETSSSYRRSEVGIMSPILIQNSSFVSYHGLGATFGSVTKDVFRVLQFTRQQSYRVEFEKTAWCNNSIFFDVERGDKWCHQLFAQSPSNRVLYLKMNHVFIKNNLYDNYDYIKDDRLSQRFSGSMMLCINTDVTISGNSYIGQNFGGSAIGAVSSNVTITGNLTIRDGYSYCGGGIRLDSYSYLFLREPLHAQFINNSAKQGSAIYAPVHTSTLNEEDSSTISSIQIWPSDVYTPDNLTSINVSLKFTDIGLNTVSYSPSLYAPSFNFAHKQISPYLLFNDDILRPTYHLTELIDTIIESDDKFRSLSNGYCLKVYQEMNCSYIDKNYFKPVGWYQNAIRIHSGEMAVSLPCEDSKNYLILYTTSNYYDIVREIPCETKNYEYWNTTVSLVDKTMSLAFSGNTDTFFYIAQLSEGYPNPVQIVGVNVLSYCPFGFEMTEMGVCECANPLKQFNFKCDINTRRITSPHHYWARLHYEPHDDQHAVESVSYILLGTKCPPKHCSSHNNASLRVSDFHYSSFRCLNNRNGTLCGQCKDNLSIVFGSDECRECSHLYLLTLPVYAVAGLLLVVLLFALRLTVSTGTVNGLIFYANVLDLSMDSTKLNMGPLRIIISLLNLNLGLPLCLYDGMTTAEKAGLQFVFPVYLWSIVVGLIIAARYSTRLSNVISQSSVQVLATLFYLSFSRLVQASVYIVSSSTIFSIKAAQVDPSDPSSGITYITDSYTVWLYDGMPYNTGVHTFLLVVVSMFAVFFIIPYPILLTFSQCLVQYKLTSKIRPFLDVYNANPFKDKWRFWFGLRLWVIVILIFLSNTLQGSNVNIAHLMVISLFILLQVHVLPFRSRAVGILDASFMINLIMLLYFAHTDAEMKFQEL